MALSRGLSTVAMSVSSSDDSHFRRPRSISRSDSHSSVDSLISQPQGMPIHSRRNLCAPPPLPPPQYIEELDRGQDIAHELQHNEYSSNTGLPPIPEGSSLRGGSFARPSPRQHYRRSMDVDEDTGRRVTSSSMMHPAHADGGAGAHSSKIARRAPSPSASNTMLQGELPLAQESHDRSNRDYDHAILSKIGKQNSPPRHPRADSSDSPVLGQKLSLQIKDMKAQKTPTNEPTSAIGSSSQWVTSPTSTGLSPGARYGWQEQRSPPLEGSTNTLVLDPELFVQSRPTHHQPTDGATPGREGTPNRSTRNSYDQATYTPSESGMTEDSCHHAASIGEAQAASRNSSGIGMKRKAPSPSGDRPSDERPRQELYPLRMRASRSPNTNYTSNGGSISSAASSVHPQSSYSSGPYSAASSAPFSAAPSSMTSMSSFDPNSPRDQSLTSPFITSGQPVASPISNLAFRKGQEKLVPRKLSVQTALSPRPTPTRIGNNYICACCPKKPKKFETEEQLRQHENEKQYSCNFCHNRFKNKNEAERHQNSLHLRRHSWSCAALASFQAAFSPSGAVDSSSTATDACGYCGEEFPNHPAPDWDRRLEHLTNVHKFGECNSAKKFFRADHFRQHLKHSHAGRSGKWTNILEHACVRDEIPPEPMNFAAATADHNPAAQGRGRSGLSGPSDVAAGTNVVRGSQDDST